MVRYIDISVEFQDGVDGNILPPPEAELPIYCGHRCAAFDLFLKSHHGTYYETSSHLFSDGQNTCDIPVEDFFLPLAVIRLTGTGIIAAKELEENGKHVRPGDALLVFSHDPTRYLDATAAQWMAQNKIRLFGASLKYYDCGFVNPTGFFVELFKANIPIIANLKSLDQIPTDRASLIVLPLKISGIGTTPCRAVVEL